MVSVLAFKISVPCHGCSAFLSDFLRFYKYRTLQYIMRTHNFVHVIHGIIIPVACDQKIWAKKFTFYMTKNTVPYVHYL